MISQEHDEVQRYIDEDENARGRTATFASLTATPTETSPLRAGNTSDNYLAQSSFYEDRPFQGNKELTEGKGRYLMYPETERAEEYNYPLHSSCAARRKTIGTRNEECVEDSYERIKAEMRKQMLGSVPGRIDKEFVDKLEIELDKIINQAKKEVDENTSIIKREIDNKIASQLKLLHKEMEEKYKLSLIHICRCRRYAVCRSRWSPYH
eukprot:TRINITY_DN17095_c0_g1_i1.p1 TRINITY_DN17095_c0_g1~~TRINITY_DN17095_c0_g1_i1.p1  ORF type:complete len:209 (-),score=47.90 TRINITY_DN17095_c0_g1_i1:10-636(-)